LCHCVMALPIILSWFSTPVRQPEPQSWTEIEMVSTERLTVTETSSVNL